jgi:hypothetical protein
MIRGSSHCLVSVWPYHFFKSGAKAYFEEQAPYLPILYEVNFGSLTVVSVVGIRIES